MKPLFQTLLVLLLLTVSVGLLLHLADDKAHLCDFDLPAGGVGCYLRQYGDLAGGLLGAAGTIFAGWIAWLGVQGQIKKGEIAFLHERRDASAEALYGLNFLQSIVDDWLSGFGAADPVCAYPNIEVLRCLQKRGMLQSLNFAPSARTFLAWHLAKELLKLRTAFARLDDLPGDEKAREAEQRDTEQLIAEALDGLRQIKAQVGLAIAREQATQADLTARIARDMR